MAGTHSNPIEILQTPPKPAYLAMLISKASKLLGVVRLSAKDEEQAIWKAKSMVDGHAVELWDGLRYIDYFPEHY